MERCSWADLRFRIPRLPMETRVLCRRLPSTVPSCLSGFSRCEPWHAREANHGSWKAPFGVMNPPHETQQAPLCQGNFALLCNYYCVLDVASEPRSRYRCLGIVGPRYSLTNSWWTHHHLSHLLWSPSQLRFPPLSPLLGMLDPHVRFTRPDSPDSSKEYPVEGLWAI